LCQIDLGQSKTAQDVCPPFESRLWNAGYDGGVTGGIVVMQPFAEEFFPSTVGVPDTNFYCKYDDRVLQTFPSIMHFTGALAAFPAGYFTAKYGRTR